MKDHYGGSTHL